MANKPQEFKQWSNFSYVEMKAFQRQFYEYYTAVLRIMNLTEQEITYNNDALAEIINRVEKRRIYFWIYYESELNELNEIALFCYWMVKLKPFYKKDDQCINEKIGLFYFFHRLEKYIRDKNAKIDNEKEKLVLRISVRIIKVLSYDLRYREISKEALMTFAEALTG
ncbi:hypothetical protein FACS189494_05380 [Spirochaetia bacterium]|nr:hypothetical protein FACS189494_05380 [Spirochaetia bacterium]